METAKARRKQIREQMHQRQDESYQRKDDSGRFKSIYKSEISRDKFWKCNEAEHSLDIIPYPVGDNDPHNKKGNWTYLLDLFVHNKVGVNEDSYVCLNRNYNKNCPICEYQAELRKQDDYDEDIVKALNPTRRAIYNIWVHDNSKEEDKGIQIWDVSHYLFELNLIENSRKKKGGGYILFSDPDEGKTISFRRSGKGPTSTKFVAITFEDRDAIPDNIMDAAHVLDELIHIPTYEEVNIAFYGAIKEEKTKETKTKEEDIPEPPENECPADFEFGKDYGDYDDCDDCEVSKACKFMKRDLRLKAKGEEEATVIKAKDEKKEEITTTRRRRASTTE